MVCGEYVAGNWNYFPNIDFFLWVFTSECVDTVCTRTIWLYRGSEGNWMAQVVSILFMCCHALRIKWQSYWPTCVVLLTCSRWFNFKEGTTKSHIVYYRKHYNLALLNIVIRGIERKSRIRGYRKWLIILNFACQIDPFMRHIAYISIHYYLNNLIWYLRKLLANLRHIFIICDRDSL